MKDLALRGVGGKGPRGVCTGLKESGVSPRSSRDRGDTSPTFTSDLGSVQEDEVLEKIKI